MNINLSVDQLKELLYEKNLSNQEIFEIVSYLCRSYDDNQEIIDLLLEELNIYKENQKFWNGN